MGAVFERKDGNTVIRMPEGRPFRILQLTDLHLGGNVFSRKHDKLAIEAVQQLVSRANADFIVITGDLVYPLPFMGGLNNLKSSKIAGELMESFGIPWTLVFGNHDSEIVSFYKKDKLADYYTALPHCFFEKGDEKITGCGNYCIRLENTDGTLNNALMFLDSNAYVTWSFFSGFDIIHDDQIEWYKDTIADLSKNGETAKSLAFYHIPPKEFKDGWEKCYSGSEEAKYHLGFVQEKDNYFGYPKTVEGRFFSEMVKLGSCKGMFVGHDHLNTLSITYQGIRLTYGMSVDYHAYKGIAKKYTQRGGTIIEIYDDATFDVKLLPLNDI